MKIKQLKYSAILQSYRCRGMFNITFHIVIVIYLYCSIYSLFSAYQNIKSTASQSRNIIYTKKKLRPCLSYQANVNFIYKITIRFSILIFLIWICIVLTNTSKLYTSHVNLILSGDVHPNPGPDCSISYDSNDSTSPNSSLLKSNFSFVHYNIQSLLPKIDILGIELKDFDVLTFSETWLKSETKSDDLIIPLFQNPVRKDRDDGYGGVIIYVKENLSYKRRQDLEVIGVESIWIEIQIFKKSVLFGVFYRPPNSSSNYLNSIDDSISLAFDSGIKDIIVTGDFNLNILQHPSQQKVTSLSLSYGLTQLIDQPTHFTEHSSSILDLIFVNDTTNVLLSGVGDPFLDQENRYHCPIYCIFKFKKPKVNSFKRQIWLYDKGNYDNMRRQCNMTNWTDGQNDSVDLICTNITEKINHLKQQYIPNKQITIRPYEPPWITSKIKTNIRRRKRLYRKAKTTNCTNDWTKFKKLRNETISLIRKAKTEYLKSIADKLQSENLCSSTWWKTLKTLIKPTSKSSIPTLYYNNIEASSEHEKANLLNDFFTDQTVLNETHADLPILTISNQNLSTLIFDEDEVKDVLGCLPLGKASGHDEINNKILRELASELSVPLTFLFNKSISDGYFPSSWKDANVCAIYKKDDPSLVNNYRPISLLCNLEKVFEKLVFKRIYNFYRDNNFLSSFQSGFMPGDSTVCQLTYIYNSFCKALDEGKEVRVVFFDISKAFDRVWHKGLIAKLKSSGINGNLLSWFSSYLENRRQRVLLPGSRSNWSNVKAGVPQGSILGPLLFLVYINDIVSDIHCNIRLFADDTSLYLNVDHPDVSAQHLNSDILKIMKWADTWLVSFNPNKTESFIISRKQIKPHHPPLVMLGSTINNVKSHKHLGVFISNDCSWRSHIDYIKEKAWKRIHVMRKLKFTLDRKSLEIIYTTFIRPVLEYADVIWGNCSITDKQELDKIQNEAARIVTGASKLVSLRNLYKETGWESLETRRNNHKLVLFYKMYHGEAPPYLSSMIPPLVGDASSYHLRNSDNIQTIPCRTKLFSESFLPSTIHLWNTLPVEIRNSRSVSSFKHSLANVNQSKPPAYYYSGTRNVQIYHTKLRTNCSSLNLTLFQKNIIESPQCQCGGIESTDHYFFHCPLFTDQRLLLFANVHPPLRSTQLFLFGSNNLTFEENVQLFNAVQSYISQTKRFNPAPLQP